MNTSMSTEKMGTESAATESTGAEAGATQQVGSVSGPDFIALQVRDVEAAARFYESHLGLTRAPVAPPGAVVFTTSPIPIAVREPLPGVDLDAGDLPGNGVALWLRCDDARALHDSLAEAGVEILRAPAPSPFGLTFAFADPDGYAVTLHDAG
ncbi:VOC family protein [Brevibacterium sp. JSBI002]|uniref:VOC family protein n=1 Tax=Brevibacterium sp. JSBI002 TaxID=2886045 RepID=UPI002232B8A6|nr:VOC family protein [Brevibacterium sp. JSBI002]UZD62346.1 VOC family protein [Brevibacterium sp. JSBI002]